MKKNPLLLTAAGLSLAFSPLLAESYLGVYSDAVDPALGAQLALQPGFGLVVGEVAKGSPAAASGLKEHDVLVTFDGQRLVNAEQLRTLVGSTKGEVTLEIIRAGKAKTIKTTLAERPPEQAAVAKNASKGQILPNARVHTFSFGNGGNLDVPGWVNLGNMGNLDEIEGLDGFGDEIRRQIQAALSGVEVKGMMNGQPGPSSETVTINSSAGTMSTVFSDGEHTLTINGKDEEKSLKVTDKDGEVLFEGPISNKKQRTKVPAEILEKLEDFEGMVDVTTSAVGGAIEIQLEESDSDSGKGE